METGQEVVLSHSAKPGLLKGKIGQLYSFEGLKMVPITRAEPGDIVAFSGIPDAEIGQTVNSPETVLPLPAIEVDAPTLTMIFKVNDGPFAAQDSIYLTSRHLRDRLYREARTNVALRVEDTDSPDQYRVSVRGNCISVCSLKRCAVKDTVSALPNPSRSYGMGPTGSRNRMRIWL